MKRVITASTESDMFLPFEHQLDLAMEEAYAFFRSHRNNYVHASWQVKEMGDELQKMKSKLRNLRKFTYDDYRYVDTEESMREDQSRYLED